MKNENDLDTKIKLLRLIIEHPDARIVTDVGASKISGWDDLKFATWIESCNVIELEFK